MFHKKSFCKRAPSGPDIMFCLEEIQVESGYFYRNN